ncbi:hypothetical protein PR048_004332 [Dryococelus australis]|uniref:Uncharacterized protein n=1 Tax=Dryococelus australis TaxID=614101 RepID=A0ABQ9I563_9NEOP|nr:hypothetical protein PR048_004332 [Dryococelus australis]
MLSSGTGYGAANYSCDGIPQQHDPARALYTDVRKHVYLKRCYVTNTCHRRQVHASKTERLLQACKSRNKIGEKNAAATETQMLVTEWACSTRGSGHECMQACMHPDLTSTDVARGALALSSAHNRGRACLHLGCPIPLSWDKGVVIGARQRIRRLYSDRVNVTSLDAEFRTRPQERLNLDTTLHTQLYYRAGPSATGRLQPQGVGPLVFVRGSMNTEAYCNILDNEMLPTLWRFYGMDPCYFQDDNARCHVSRATMQWFADNNVRRLDWPAQSPDLNPKEHLRDELDRRTNDVLRSRVHKYVIKTHPSKMTANLAWSSRLVRPPIWGAGCSVFESRARHGWTTVAERLACLPTTKAIRVQSPAGSLRIFARRETATIIEVTGLAAGRRDFSRPSHSTTRLALIGSQNLIAETRPNLSSKKRLVILSGLNIELRIACVAISRLATSPYYDLAECQVKCLAVEPRQPINLSPCMFEERSNSDWETAAVHYAGATSVNDLPIAYLLTTLAQFLTGSTKQTDPLGEPERKTNHSDDANFRIYGELGFGTCGARVFVIEKNHCYRPFTVNKRDTTLPDNFAGTNENPLRKPLKLVVDEETFRIASNIQDESSALRQTARGRSMQNLCWKMSDNERQETTPKGRKPAHAKQFSHCNVQVPMLTYRIPYIVKWGSAESMNKYTGQAFKFVLFHEQTRYYSMNSRLLDMQFQESHGKKYKTFVIYNILAVTRGFAHVEHNCRDSSSDVTVKTSLRAGQWSRRREGEPSRAEPSHLTKSGNWFITCRLAANQILDTYWLHGFTETQELGVAELSYVHPYVIRVRMRVIVERVTPASVIRFRLHVNVERAYTRPLRIKINYGGTTTMAWPGIHDFSMASATVQRRGSWAGMTQSIEHVERRHCHVLRRTLNLRFNILCLVSSTAVVSAPVAREARMGRRRSSPSLGFGSQLRSHCANVGFNDASVKIILKNNVWDLVSGSGVSGLGIILQNEARDFVSGSDEFGLRNY